MARTWKRLLENLQPFCVHLRDEEGRASDVATWPFARLSTRCAWCRREGKRGYLGMREPFEDPRLTHGICADHQKQVLESMPSRSFPDAELLIVVHRNNITLYEHLQRWVAGAPAVRVLVDRRTTDRRSRPARSPTSGGTRERGGFAKARSLRTAVTRWCASRRK